jgi:N-glycosylase/DNA lyase
MGVGNKVADCITLFSLDKPQCIPVDTHVFQIAKRFKFTSNKNDNLNDKIYHEINEAFVNKYGDKAGWAHQILFAGDLDSF